MLICKAEQQDIDAVENGYTELLLFEKDNKSWSNWALGIYPTRTTAQQALESNTLYVLKDKNQICASMILNQLQAEEYRDMKWRYPAKDEEVLVIHTLCVPPSMAGNGYGRAMVQYALKLANEMSCHVIRLDTFAGNEPAATLYKGFGFEYSGSADVLLQGLIEEKQIFFEKLLAGTK